MARTWSAVLARMGIPTGDGRILDPAGGSSRSLPLPLSWQRETEDGHGGSTVVARIESMQFRDGMVTATGSMLDSAPGEVLELLEAGVIGPSVDLDDVEYVMDADERIVLTQWRVAGATLVSIPAFADVSLTLDPLPVTPSGNMAEWSAETANAALTDGDRVPAGFAARASTSGADTASSSPRSSAPDATQRSRHVVDSATTLSVTRAMSNGNGTGTTLGLANSAPTRDTPGPNRKPQRDSGGVEPRSDDGSLTRTDGGLGSDSSGSSGSTWNSSTPSKTDGAGSVGTPSKSRSGSEPTLAAMSTTTTTLESYADGSAPRATGGSGLSETILSSFDQQLGGSWNAVTGLRASAVGPESLPPLEWFQRPSLTQATPLTICPPDEHGRVRVFGTIAAWDSCHVGLPGCVTPPPSQSGYQYFTVASQRTQEGVSVPVGTLVAGPRHADAQAAFRAAMEHYDDPGAAVARVTAGEDEYGIWVAGWMLPGARPEAVDVFTSSPVSGDWRRIGGNLELIAVCSVNTPGFPVPRARVNFASGAQRTLIASFGITPQSGTEMEAGVTSVASTGDENRARWAWAQAQEGI